MNELAERRRLLALEAELHRAIMVLERTSLQVRLARLTEARERVVAGGPWLAAGSAVAGFVALRHWRKLARWIPAGVTVLQWFKSG